MNKFSKKLSEILRSLFEDQEVTGLPMSRDPYSPAQQEFKDAMGPEEQEEFEEPDLDMGGEFDSLGEEPLGEEPTDPYDEAPGLEEPADLGFEGMPETEEEERPTWNKTSFSKNDELEYKRSDGFYLRARRLKSTENEWLAQLIKYEDGEGIELDKGRVRIPSEQEPEYYLQMVADRMLG